MKHIKLNKILSLSTATILAFSLLISSSPTITASAAEKDYPTKITDERLQKLANDSIATVQASIDNQKKNQLTRGATTNIMSITSSEAVSNSQMIKAQYKQSIYRGESKSSEYGISVAGSVGIKDYGNIQVGFSYSENSTWYGPSWGYCLAGSGNQLQATESYVVAYARGFVTRYYYDMLSANGNKIYSSSFDSWTNDSSKIVNLGVYTSTGQSIKVENRYINDYWSYNSQADFIYYLNNNPSYALER